MLMKKNSNPTPQNFFLNLKKFGERFSIFFSVNFTEICIKKFRSCLLNFLSSREVKKKHEGGMRIFR
jgi:hypothetical protein